MKMNRRGERKRIIDQNFDIIALFQAKGRGRELAIG